MIGGAVMGSGGAALGGHNAKPQEADDARPGTSRGLMADGIIEQTMELSDLARSAGQKAPLRHVYASPPPDANWSEHEWDEYWSLYEQAQGLETCAFSEAIHDKPGPCGRPPHRHRVYLALTERGTLVRQGHDYAKQEAVSRIMEFRTGQAFTKGAHNILAAPIAARLGFPEVAEAMHRAGLLDGPRARSNLTPAQRAQQERTGINKSDVASLIGDAWKSSDGPQAFLAAVRDAGMAIAMGDKTTVVVDPSGNSHALSRMLAMHSRSIGEASPKAAEINRRMHGVELPTLDAARQEIRNSADQKNAPATRAPVNPTHPDVGEKASIPEAVVVPDNDAVDTSALPSQDVQPDLNQGHIGKSGDINDGIVQRGTEGAAEIAGHNEGPGRSAESRTAAPSPECGGGSEGSDGGCGYAPGDEGANRGRERPALGSEGTADGHRREALRDGPAVITDRIQGFRAARGLAGLKVAHLIDALCPERLAVRAIATERTRIEQARSMAPFADPSLRDADRMARSARNGLMRDHRNRQRQAAMAQKELDVAITALPLLSKVLLFLGMTVHVPHLPALEDQARRSADTVEFRRPSPSDLDRAANEARVRAEQHQLQHDRWLTGHGAALVTRECALNRIEQRIEQGDTSLIQNIRDQGFGAVLAVEALDHDEPVDQPINPTWLPTPPTPSRYQS